MNDNLLSQEEIDALFAKRKEEREKKTKGKSGSSTADPTDKGGGLRLPRGVTLYDFHNPNRLAKEEIQRLRVVHQSFLRSANISFSVMMETPVEGALTAMEQLTYREFMQSLPPITCICTAQFEGHEGEFLIEISPSLLFPLISRMLGGAGDPNFPNRELTEIETSIARHIFTRYLEILARSWSPSEEDMLNCTLMEIETSPRFISAAAESQSVLAAVLQIRVGGEEGSLSICYPHTLIEPLIEQLGLVHQPTRHSRRPEIGASLGRVPVDVHAILGGAEVDLPSLIDLREGDVIRLDKDITQPIDVYAGEVLVAEARPGTKNERRAFQVLRVSDSREGLRE